MAKLPTTQTIINAQLSQSDSESRLLIGESQL